MGVKGKDPFDSFSAHENKGNAIGKTDLILSKLLKQFNRFYFIISGWAQDGK